MAANEREITADMLVELENGGQSNRILEEHLAALLYLPKHARAFISRVFLGTTERQITIDAVLASFSKTPVRKMKPLVRAILRMSVYQILYRNTSFIFIFIDMSVSGYPDCHIIGKCIDNR